MYLILLGKHAVQLRVGVVIISHNMNDVMQVSDSVACLYLGNMAAQVPSSQLTHSQIVELITTGRSGDLGLHPELVNGVSA